MCLVLLLLAATAMAQQAGSPTVGEVEDIVVSGERERLRKSTRPIDLTYPDVITVTRNGEPRVRLKPVRPERELLFRRDSIARQLTPESGKQPLQLQRDRLTAEGKDRIEDVTLEFAADIEERDGLPAVIPYGSGLSIVNIDYVRLRDAGRSALIDVINAVHPQTRNCMARLGIADDTMDYANRFILLGDELGDCARAVRNRDGDLYFAEGVPERLRQDVIDIFGPVSNRFALKLGSEPGMVLVAWRPDALDSNMRFEYSWSRNTLLLFNGRGWQQGLGPKQRDALWESFAKEQILRRLQWQGRPDAFTLSAASYLLLLARFERENTSSQRLAAELPNWISACASDLAASAVAEKSSPEGGSSLECGRVLQFVYDAVERARSKGKNTVYRTWRTLLTESFRREESGVEPKAFIGSSTDARRIAQGLLNGSMDWPRFVDELNKYGVRMRIKPDRSGIFVEVLSLDYFQD